MTKQYAGFTVAAHGTIYRSAAGLQGYYARVLRLGPRELIASFVASTSIESADSHPEITRSLDGGATWQLEGPVDRERPPRFPPTETGFISKDADGSLMCLGARWDVDPRNPELPLVDPKTVGMRDNTVLLRRSKDGGRTWSQPQVLPKPLPAPLELPTAMGTLPDGTNLMSCATWREVGGACPYGHRIVITQSEDRCRNWTPPVTLFHDPTNDIGYWEGRVIALEGAALLATCWAHNWKTDQDVPNPFVTSRDRGRTWTAPTASPVNGQTGWPLWLGGSQVLFVYNYRRQPAGVRAQLARIEGTRWTTLFDELVWSPEVQRASTITKDDYAVTDFQFGAPSAIRLDGDEILVIYWCVVKGRAGIGFSRINLR
jgi:hypothetical protein